MTPLASPGLSNNLRLNYVHSLSLPPSPLPGSAMAAAAVAASAATESVMPGLAAGQALTYWAAKPVIEQASMLTKYRGFGGAEWSMQPLLTGRRSR
jgi:hypothetical protein